MKSKIYKGNKKGVTLIELMVALAILGIIVLGIYSVYTSTYRTYLGQERLAEIQQSARTGLEQMLREIKLAKYIPDGIGCANGIATANASYLEFDGDVDFDGITERIIYSYDNPNDRLQRHESNSAGNCTALVNPAFTLIAEQIDDLQFAYFDSNNTSPPSDLDGDGVVDADGTNVDDITRIEVTVSALSDQADPSTGRQRSITFATDVQLRNMGSGGSQVDNPPDTPENFLVADPGICGRLTLSWTANTESDLAGYRLYYRPSTSAIWTGTKTVDLVTAYTLTGLTDGTTYYIALAALDSGGNLSALTPLVGDGLATSTNSPNNGGPHDTTPGDTTGPNPPTDIDAIASTSGSLYVTLKGLNSAGSSNWTPPSDADLAGYNIRRSNDGGSTWVGPVNGGTIVTNTTFTDTTMTNKCRVYRYKIRSVDSCGNEGADSAIVYGDGSAGGSADVPTGTGGNRTNTRPADTTGPSSPDNPNPFSAAAGSTEIWLSWSVPSSDPDFEGSVLLYTSANAAGGGSCPNRNVQSNVSSGTDPTTNFSSDNELGPFLFPQNSYQHTGLTNGMCYYYRAFNYDTCWNYTASGQQMDRYICDDNGTYDPACTQCYYCQQSPQPPRNLDVNACAISNGVELTWNTPTEACGVPKDLSGYYVYRAENLVALFGTSSPTSQTLPLSSARINFDAFGNPLPIAAYTVNGVPQYTTVTFDDVTALPGKTYYYAIVAFDCNGRGLNTAPYAIATTTDSGNTLTYITVSPGEVTEGVDFGISTGSNTSTTLNDTNKSWTSNAYAGYSLKITAGTGSSNPTMAISSNTSTSLTVSSSWVTTPDETSRYRIVKPAKAIETSGKYNKVDYANQNTSASSMIFKDNSYSGTATITWQNSGGTSGADKNGNTAYLTKIELDDGMTLWSSGSGVSTGTQVTFTGDKTFSSLEKRTLKIEFKTPGGSSDINMKGETISVTFTYKNNDTGDTCTSQFSFTVPNGPTISNTLQLPPDAPTGPVTPSTTAGTYIFEAGDVSEPADDCVYSDGDGTTDDCIYASTEVTPESGTTISSIILYYCEQGYSTSACGSTMTSAAPDPSTYTYTAVTMTNYSGTYVGYMPNKPGRRIWYYIKATDGGGNDAIAPTQSSSFTAYTYDQNKMFKIDIRAQFPNAADRIEVLLYVDDQDNVDVSGANVSVSFTGTCDITSGTSLTGTTSGTGSYSGTTGTGAVDCNPSSEYVIPTATLTASGFTSRSCSVTLTGSIGLNNWVSNTCN